MILMGTISMTESRNKEEIFADIDEAVTQLLSLFSSVDEKEINEAPYKGSWTPAQLLRHVTKSTFGMSKAMTKPAEPANRDAGERIPKLKETFLDFTTKMQSPEGIVPEEGPYEKQGVMDDLKESFELLKERAEQADLNGNVEGLPLGPITKLEILYFVVYHTQRHLNQLHKICNELLYEHGTQA